MGGIGKTELATQYSLKYLKQKTYPGGICWLNSREQDINSQIVDFAYKKLDLEAPEKLEQVDKVAWLWENWQEGKTLIIFDDVKNYNDIRPHIPHG